MTTTVTDVPERDRYELTVDGEVLGAAFYQRGDGVVVFTHTEVDDDHEGEGLGSTLVSEALDDVRRRDLRVVPRCPFVSSYIERHPEYADLVDGD